MNRFLVGVAKLGEVRILRPPAPFTALDRKEALNLAAWVAVLADLDAATVARAMRAVESDQDTDEALEGGSR